MKGKTYDDFGEAVDKLRVNADLSYDRMALEIGIPHSYLYNMINKRRISPPKDKIIKKIADFFHVRPEYFYEWRKKRFLEFVNENRKFLDEWPTILNNYKTTKGE